MKKFSTFLFILFFTTIFAFADEPWTPQEYFSPDGKYRVVDQTGGLVSKKWSENTLLFSVYKNGSLYDEIEIRKVFKNPHMVEYVSTVSHFHWGNFLSIDNEGINLIDNEGEKKYIFETQEIQSETHQSQSVYDELESLIKASLPLIKNENDRNKISAALKTILSLSHSRGNNINTGTHNYNLFKSGEYQLTISENSGFSKGAGTHFVKRVFDFKSPELNITIFLTDDDCDLYIAIHGGGDKKNFKGKWGEDFDYPPERFYEFNTKKLYARTGDFYWD